MTTPDLIAQAEAALDGVTPGEWRAFDTAIHIGINGDTYADGRPRWGGMDVRHMPDAQANARFIAWCRAGVPALIARIRELEGERDKADTFAKALTEAARGLVCDVLEATTRAEAAEAKLAEVEKERVEQWNLRRDADGSRDAARAAADTMRAERDAAEATVATLTAQVEAMRDQLRLIELLGYREGEQFGWLVAHMRGVANDALEGRTSAHMWRLFPKHRPAALTTENQTNG